MMTRLERYADYEEMDTYSMLQGPYSEDMTSWSRPSKTPRTPKTPLQELAERTWAEHDPTDPPITFDIVVDPSVKGAWPLL